MISDVTQHICASSADVWSQTGRTPGSLLYFIDFCHKAWLTGARERGRERKSWVRFSGRKRLETGAQSCKSSRIQCFFFHLPLPCLIEVQNNFSIGDRLCPVRIIRGGSPQPPVPSHVWSSELGVTTEFPSSCNNFTQPADTDRQPGSSHSLHITGQHENSDNTS